MSHSTGYADVDAILAELLAGVRGTLGPQLVGVYLDGSLAIGDFSEHSSDIDVLVVTEETLSDGHRRARHDARAARHGNVEMGPRARGLVHPAPCTSPLRSRRHSHPHIERLSDQLVTEAHERDWVIHRYIVREHGVTLAGLDPRTLINPIDAEELRHSVVSLLHGWWMPAPTCRRWLNNPFYRSYAVLTMCRMRHTLQYGTVVSKPIAACWAQTALDARWTPLIQTALAWSRDIVPDLGDTLRFIDDTRQASKQ